MLCAVSLRAKLVPALLPALVVAGLASLPVNANAGPKRSFDSSDGSVDPRAAPLPRRHRFRLGISSAYMRLSQALSSNTGEALRFHWAPLMADFSYQLQFFKRMMFRPGLALGPNVANSRYAMPFTIAPSAFLGYQGSRLGIAAGYTYYSPLHPGATVLNGGDGRPGAIGGPIIFRNHALLGELSFTSRIDSVALYFAAGAGAVRSNLIHFSLSKPKSWRFAMTVSAGVYFDGTRRREKKRAAAQRPSAHFSAAGRPKF